MNALALRVLAIGIAALLLATASYQFGRHVKTGEVAAEDLKTAEATATKTQELQDKADLLATANTLLRSQKDPKERIITKEIENYVYVTPPNDRCTLPGTWRVRHDSAATGIPAPAETGSVATRTDAPVEDLAALETASDNYRTARECADKLAGWIKRYRTLELGEQTP